MQFEDMINKIINGDCYELIKNIPDNSIDCIYVDVPYLYNSGGTGSSDLCKSLTKHKLNLMGMEDFKIDSNKPLAENLRIAKNCKNRNKDIVSISDGFDYKLFIKEAFRVMKIPNMFIWCSPLQILDIMNELHKYCDSTITILTWNKTNPIPATNNNWLSDIEYCLYIRGAGVKLNDGYELKSKWFTSSINQYDKGKFNHPTIKPLPLVERHLKHATQENDIVADFFCGSGTTCVACKNINRKYIGIEINPKWAKVSIDRLNNTDANGQISLFTN